MRIRLLSILLIGLLLQGCIPYLAGVVATSRANSRARANCIESGNQWIDGSSWGWDVGQCMSPDAKLDTPQAKCEALNGVWHESTKNCKFAAQDANSPQARCLAMDGTWYEVTQNCKFETQETDTPKARCESVNGTWYEATGSCRFEANDMNP